MSFRIAVVGKGGVGKTTISALLVRALHERTGKVVMAVDADPNSNLGEKLGVMPERTIGDLREKMLKSADDLPAGQSKQEYVEYQMRLATVEGDGFDLLSMGRPEGPGCYCYINNIMRTFLDEAMDDYDFVVIDNEAGRNISPGGRRRAWTSWSRSPTRRRPGWRLSGAWSPWRRR